MQQRAAGLSATALLVSFAPRLSLVQTGAKEEGEEASTAAAVAAAVVVQGPPWCPLRLCG